MNFNFLKYFKKSIDKNNTIVYTNERKEEIKMKYTVRKSGNSLVLTIPTFVARTLGITNGTKMDLELQGKKIIIRKEANQNEKENTKE
jgi:bifunctional DNA-binding transcriptional regulator/antitoxin component of YhaV-PrlF toxin-antitoxin module